MTPTNTDFSKITLSINDFKPPNEICKPADWVKEQDPFFCCLKQYTSLLSTDSTLE